MGRKIDQFELKRYQNKRLMDYQSVQSDFQRYFVGPENKQSKTTSLFKYEIKGFILVKWTVYTPNKNFEGGVWYI